jgi:predicted transcriptional regulator
MAMTLRLTPDADRVLAELAKTLRTSKNSAAAKAIDLAVPRSSHPSFVAASTRRLLGEYADLMSRLAEA